MGRRALIIQHGDPIWLTINHAGTTRGPGDEVQFLSGHQCRCQDLCSARDRMDHGVLPPGVEFEILSTLQQQILEALSHRIHSYINTPQSACLVISIPSSSLFPLLNLLYPRLRCICSPRLRCERVCKCRPGWRGVPTPVRGQDKDRL
jgi:hypothetical protein